MDGRSTQTRRRLLTACAGATAGVATLAGCMSDDENSEQVSDNEETSDGSGDNQTDTEYGSWPMVHYDAANTAVAPNSGLYREPEMEWSIEFDSEPSIPVVTEGMIFVGTRGGTYYGIDINDREIHWEYTTGEFDPPAVSSKAVYISGNGVEAVDHEDGAQIWASDHRPFSNLRISDETVYGSTSQYVYGVEEESGNEMVEIEASGEVDYISVGENNIYVKALQEEEDYQLEAYNKESGEQLWSHRTDDLWDTQFTLVEGIIYAIDDQSFISIDVENGEKELIKEFELYPDGVPRRPTVYDDIAYVPNSVYFELPAINLQTQNELPEWDYEGAITAWRSVVSDEVLYVWGSADAQSGLTLHTIDLESGEVNWRFETTGAEDPGVPVVLEDRIVFADDGEEQITVLE